MRYFSRTIGPVYIELALYGLPQRISADVSLDFQWKEVTLGAALFFGAFGLVVGWDR